MLEAVQQFREQDTVCITELSKQTEERTVQRIFSKEEQVVSIATIAWNRTPKSRVLTQTDRGPLGLEGVCSVTQHLHLHLISSWKGAEPDLVRRMFVLPIFVHPIIALPINAIL